MLAQLKRLGSETVVYGTSTIVGRFLNFLLVPLYTNVLRPDQYGIITYVYSIMAFVNVIYSYGMESAYFKYSSTLEIGTGRENFTTPFSSLFASSLFFSWAIAGFASRVRLLPLVGVPAASAARVRRRGGMAGGGVPVALPVAAGLGLAALALRR